MSVTNGVAAKVMGEILAKGMSLANVDLSKTVDSEAVRVLSKIKTVLSEDKNQSQKLEKVQEIISEYNI